MHTFFALTYNKNLFDISKFYEYLISKYGKIELMSTTYNLSSFTNYYNNEMGEDLCKQIVSIKGIRSIDNLHLIKINTNEIEEQFSINNKRVINIDPGYITEAKVILFSTKNNIHRIYINNNIFAEITLFYKKASFNFKNTTYPDYRQNEILEYFNSLRKTLRVEMQNEKNEME